MKKLYTSKATATGGREGRTRSSDGVLDFKIEIPKEMGGFLFGVDLEVAIPGIDSYTANKLLTAAHQVYPYSNATRGNIEVSLHLAS